MLRRLVTSLAIASGLLALAAAPAAAVEKLPDTIRFAAFGLGFGEPYGTDLFAIAQVKGFITAEFKGTPVKFTWSYLTGTGPAVNEGIASGQVDFAQYGSLPSIIGEANGLKTRVLMSSGANLIVGAARTGEDIRSIKDLKGKKVTFQKGTILHWAFLKAIESDGLTQRDVKAVDLKTPDQLAALVAGSVDASIGTSSLFLLRDKGLVKIFYTSRDGGPKAYGSGGVVVTDAFADKYPEATARVVRGLVKAAVWLSKEENREEVLRIWSKSGVPYSALKEQFSDDKLKDIYNPQLDDFLASQYRNVVAFAKNERLIRNDVDVNSWFAPQYLNAALKNLNLEAYWRRRAADGVN